MPSVVLYIIPNFALILACFASVGFHLTAFFESMKAHEAITVKSHDLLLDKKLFTLLCPCFNEGLCKVFSGMLSHSEIKPVSLNPCWLVNVVSLHCVLPKRLQVLSVDLFFVSFVLLCLLFWEPSGYDHRQRKK
jgi:hypothetical protein